MSERWMIFRPSSFFGSRGHSISTRSSERLLASSMAVFAIFETFPANWRNGFSAVTYEVIRSEMRARRCPAVFIYVSNNLEKFPLQTFPVATEYRPQQLNTSRTGGSHMKISLRRAVLFAALVLQTSLLADAQDLDDV